MAAEIHFVVRDWQKWRSTCADPQVDLARIADRIISNEDVWVVLTYLQLKRRGFPASVSDEPLPDRINIVDGISLGSTMPPVDTYCVGCRGDGHYPAGCQRIIHQNLIPLADQPSIHIPQWAQPGLIPRDRSRSGIRRLGFFGHSYINLSAALKEPGFLAQLSERGCELVIRGKANDGVRWNDYSDIDLVLSLRNIPPEHLRLKPANKLTNAWIAGVPAIMGPEPAIEAICADPLDYLRVREPADVLRAVDVLQNDESLYAAMVAHGQLRGAAYDDDAVARLWLGVLERIESDYESWRRLSAAGRRIDHLRRTALLAAHLEKHEKQVHREYEKLGYGRAWWESCEPARA